jgi:hypothetical protein
VSLYLPPLTRHILGDIARWWKLQRTLREHRCWATRKGVRCERELGHPGFHTAGDDLTPAGLLAWTDGGGDMRVWDRPGIRG